MVSCNSYSNFFCPETRSVVLTVSDSCFLPLGSFYSNSKAAPCFVANHVSLLVVKFHKLYLYDRSYYTWYKLGDIILIDFILCYLLYICSIYAANFKKIQLCCLLLNNFIASGQIHCSSAATKSGCLYQCCPCPVIQYR